MSQRPIADDVRHYALTLQVVVTVTKDDEDDWETIEEQIEDARSFDLLAPWEADVVAVVIGPDR